MIQGSEEWHAARLGKVTASRIADVMAVLKNGNPGASRTNYAAELIVERLTGEAPPRFQNAAMQWGIDTEPQARASYTLATFNAVEEVGFIDHPAIAMSGASPDGLVGSDGLVEIKCPNTSTHIATLLNGGVEDKYLKQMQWQMACTGRQWCDFVSFDPRMPPEMQIWSERVERDDALIAEIEDAVTGFLAEIDRQVSSLRERYISEAA